MLDIQNISKTYGNKVQAVQSLSLSLTKGVIGLIGHNGAGKTTLMQMIATLVRPSSGQILFQGVDIVKNPSAIRQKLGYLPQDFGVYPHLTAREFLQYFAALKGVRSKTRIDELLQLVYLHEQADRLAIGFSGGMRQRLGIAQALLNDPDILIVDEPTAGLDPEERLRFRHLLSELGFSKLVIVSTHIVSDIENMAQSLAIMRKGQLVAHESPEHFLAQASGKIWQASLSPAAYDDARSRMQILQAQRQGECVNVRVAAAQAPFDYAFAVEPSLEEALMAQRYALAEAA